MSKYLITFEKSGYIKYTSHLDMLRLFKRSLRKSGIRVAYSQGFNPHPKMSFALPLSLGYTGKNELIEIETQIHYEAQDIADRMNSGMPRGIEIKSAEEFFGSKTTASLVNSAVYTIEIPVGDERDYKSIAEDFMRQESIKSKKKSKKSKEIVEIEIRPLIKSLESTVIDNKIFMTTCLAQGSKETVSPESVLSAFLEFAAIGTDRSEIGITREKIIF